MTAKPFDLESFMQNLLDDKMDPDDKRAAQREAVDDVMPQVVAEVAPRIWAVLQKEMARNPTSNAYLNAVLNAAVMATLSWAVAYTPKGATNGQNNADILRRSVNASLEAALANPSSTVINLTLAARGVGELKLLNDSNETLAQIVVANSMILKGLAEQLKK